MNEVEILELEAYCLLYIDKCIGLSVIEQQCQQFRMNQCVALRFVVPIYVEDATNISPKLTELLINEPNTVEKLFIKVIWAAINTLNLFPINVDINQVHVTTRFKTVPHFESMIVRDFNKVSQISNSMRYFVFIGKVVSVSTVQQYTQSARFYCTSESCENSSGYKYISFHKIGSNEIDVLKLQNACDNCGIKLVEDINFRTVSDKIIIEVANEEAFRLIPQRTHSQKLKFIVRDELINEVKIGMNFEIIAIPLFKQTEKGYNIMFEVNSLYKKNYYQSNVIPKCIQTSLIEMQSQSPWDFVFDLAYEYAGDVSPKGSYFGLKLSILLSLVNSKLNVIAIGKDVLTINNLFNYTLKLFSSNALTCVKHNCYINDLFYTFKNESNSDLSYVEAGSFISADNGICYLGNILNYPKVQLDSIKQVIETNKIIIANKKRTTNAICRNKPTLNEKYYHFDEYKLNCNVWTYYDSTFNDRNKDVNDTSLLPNPLIDLFGIVNYTNNKLDTIELQLLDSKLNAYQEEHANNSHYSDADFKDFISVAKTRNVAFSEECEKVLRRYFVALRRLNPTKMSIHILPLLYNLSESIAKLNLHESIFETDCILSIYLYQEYLQCRYDTVNKSIITISNLQHISFNDKLNMTERLKIFHQQLKYLCDSFASVDTSSSLSFDFE